MTRFTRQLASLSATALLSIVLLAGAVGPARSAAPSLASSARIVA